MKLVNDLVIEALEATQGVESDVTLYKEYVGAGMSYTCYSLMGDHKKCLKVLSNAVGYLAYRNGYMPKDKETFSKAVNKLLDFERESMGGDVAMYWPEITGEVDYAN